MTLEWGPCPGPPFQGRPEQVLFFWGFGLLICKVGVTGPALQAPWLLLRGRSPKVPLQEKAPKSAWEMEAASSLSPDCLAPRETPLPDPQQGLENAY